MRKPSGSIRAAATVAAIVTGGLVVSAWQAAQQQKPAFRSGVELVTIDVNVVDRDGQPVRGLAPSDFAVLVGGQVRRVVSAEFVDVATAKSRQADQTIVPISTNEGAGIGRQYVFVVDQNTLDTGSARHIARAASGFFSQLSFADRTGLVVLPVGANISLTWSHDRVHGALQQVAGMSSSLGSWDYGSLAEARDIADRNPSALRIVGQRECGSASAFGRPGGGPPTGTGTGPPSGGAPPAGGGAGAPPGGGGAGGGAGGGGGGAGGTGGGSAFGMDACMRDVQMQAEATWRMAQMNSMSNLSSLRRLIETLGRVRGDKTVILISGGWPLDPR
jgi:hypothetical protein